ncbi:hypothetical protein JCM8097_000071 [Rhodosporidiobolus ruineniae]
MAGPPVGECCVCNAKTTQGCAACAKAGFSIFFCSREHQKLVWFAHKPFCGSNSKPFSFPPLSKEEAEQASSKIGMHKNYCTFGGPVTSLADELADLCFADADRVMQSDVQRVILSLQADQTPSPPLTLAERNQRLCKVRDSLRANLIDASANANSKGFALATTETPLAYWSPVNTVSKFGSRLASTFEVSSMPPFPSTEDYYIEALHHVAIFAGIHSLFHQDLSSRAQLASSGLTRPKGKELAPFIFDIAERLVGFINRLRATDPTAEQAMFAGVKSILIGSMLTLERVGGRAVLAKEQ